MPDRSHPVHPAGHEAPPSGGTIAGNSGRAPVGEVAIRRDGRRPIANQHDRWTIRCERVTVGVDRVEQDQPDDKYEGPEQYQPATSP